MRCLSLPVRLLAVLLMTLLPHVAHGQANGLIIVDEGSRLDRAAIETAAAPLLARGARVALFAVDRGRAPAFDAILVEYALSQDGLVRDDLIAIFVSFDDRYSEIRYGAEWQPALDGTVEAIQRDTLNARLAAGTASAAFADSLVALNAAIDAGGTGGGVPWILGVPVLAGGGAAGWWLFRRRRAAAAERQAHDARRREVGVTLADLGERMRIAREQARFDAVSYSEAAMTRLGQLQADVEERFTDATGRFARAEEIIASVRTPAAPQYQQAELIFRDVSAIAADAASGLDRLAGLRNELDEHNRRAPELLGRAASALADATTRVGLAFKGSEQIMRPAAELLKRAQERSTARDAAAAIQAGEQVLAATADLERFATRHMALRQQVTDDRVGATAVVAQGYRIDTGLAAFSRAEALLEEAAATLNRGVALAAPLLDQAEQALADGIRRSSALPQLHASIQRRLTAMPAALTAIDARLSAGRRAFDMVDEFAESTWRDIRGNGSEAERAVADVRSLVAQAQERATLTQQEFIEADADLDAAGARLADAEALIGSIEQRLADLEAARASARIEFDEAAAEIDRGWVYVRSNDADIGATPEQQLQQAAGLLQRAREQIALERPDWLAIVRDAQAANALADEAQASARREVDAMETLRNQAQRALHLVGTEVKKTLAFVRLHQPDLEAAQVQRAEGLGREAEALSAALERATQSEDAARATALREVTRRAQSLERLAQDQFGAAEAAFQRAEEQRAQTRAVLDDADERIDDAQSSLDGIIAGPSGVRHATLLREARQKLAEARRHAALRDGGTAARRAAEEARALAERVRSDATALRQQQALAMGAGVVAHQAANTPRPQTTRPSSSGGGWGQGGSSGGSGW